MDRRGPSTATRLRWPIYVASGLAACLAVALTASLETNRRLESNNRQMASTLAGSQDVLRSSHVTLASLTTATPSATVGDNATQSFGRVLFCPVTKHYQITVFNLRPLPAGRVYELWLITPDSRKVASGVFQVDDNGTATVMAEPEQQVDVAALAAVTDEPAGGSVQPTTTPLLMRFGFRTVMITASACAAASMALAGMLSADTPIVLIAALLMFGGMARSVGFTAYNTLAFADVPPADLPAANTLSSTVQQLAIGSARSPCARGPRSPAGRT